jgi:hypothetical protein
MTDTPFDKLGGRRFIITLGCGIATTVLQWAGKLDPAGSTYALVIVGTVGAYIAGNVAQRNAAAKAGQEQP